MNMTTIAIAVGVIVDRLTADSQWVDYVWRPSAVLAGEPDTAPWTVIGSEDERTSYYAGPAILRLHRTDTAHYRTNLTSGAPALWVVLRETGAEPPYALYLVTADPFEGEAMTEGGTIVEAVPMPNTIRDAVAAFITEHHVEQEFVKRKRDRADPEALGRRPPAARGDDE
jgi:hypothetical protein